MGLITYTDSVTGILNGVTHAFSGTYSGTIRNCILHDHDVTTAWKIVVNATTIPSIIILINAGTEDAEYRVKRNLNYYILNLPAGKKVVIHNDSRIIFGDGGSVEEIFVRSTNGTTVQVIAAY